MASKIEWTDATWNPVTGCTPVSAACDNCYARRLARRMAGRCGYPAAEPFRVTDHPNRLAEPDRWKKPRRVFVCSMGDLFHDDVPDDYLDRVFWAILKNPRHTFQILTKRPERMAGYLTSPKTWGYLMGRMTADDPIRTAAEAAGYIPNLWAGATVENQTAADDRLPNLMLTPAAVHFLSSEPLLSPVNLNGWLPDWIITGGENGPDARPTHPDWFRGLRDQADAAEIPFFFKGWGAWAVATKEHGVHGSTMPDDDPRYCWIGDDGRTARPSSHGLQTAYAMARLIRGRKAKTLDGRTHNAFPEVTP